MAAAQSPEAKELSLIGKVELRIALADTDQKLQNTLGTYLAPLLLKLASPHASVRNKVISVCSHINTRIKPDTIGLPVQALLEQFKAQNDVPLIRHFDLSYIHKGIPRLPAVEKRALFPIILKGIAANSKLSTEHESQVMNLIFQLIEYFPIPSRGTEEDSLLRTKLELSDGDGAYLAFWFGRLLLFTPVKTAAAGKPACPGLNQDEYSFLALQDKGDTWMPGSTTGLNLTQTKARIARLLASGLFNDGERFLPALFASADPASAVSDAGEDMLKRVLPNTDFESPGIIRLLLLYFFGTTGLDARLKARPVLRLRILGLLSKSLISTSFTQEIIQMVDEGLASARSDNPNAMDIDGGQGFSELQHMLNNSTSGGTSRQSRGLEAAKFRAALFSYINFVARHGKPESLHAIAPRVLTTLRDFIEEQGWPQAASVSSQQELESRGYAYEVIGLLAKAGPEDLVIEPNLDILRWLFRSQAYDRSSGSITVSVDEALSTVLTAFSRKPLAADTAQALESLLLSQMEESAEAARDPETTRRSSRYTAIRFANRCLPFSSVRARVMDLMAIGAGLGDKSEVIEEGQRGLSPYWYRMLNGSLAESEDLAFPGFADVMRFVFFEFGIQGRILDETNLDKLIVDFRHNHASLFADALLFCRLLLLHETMVASGQASIPFDSEWEHKLNVAIESDAAVRSASRGLIEKLMLDPTRKDHAVRVELLLRAFASLLTSKEALPPSASRTEAIKLFPDLCALLPDQVTGMVASEYALLQPNILSNDHGLRQTAARSFGILASHPTASGVDASLQTLNNVVSGFSSASGAAANQVQGASLALAHYYARSCLRQKTTPEPTDSLFASYFASLVNMLTDASDADVKKTAFVAIGELCLYQVIKPKAFGSTDQFKKLIDSIYDVAKGGSEPAALALGQIGTILPEIVHSEDVFNVKLDVEEPKEMSDFLPYISLRLHKLHEIRTAESHFAVGEALSYLCLGWSSTALATALDISSDPPTTPARSQTLPLILARTLKDCTTTKPSLRKASVIWLLCLVQFCGHDPAVQSHLAHCQMAFKRCLVDRDELVQETASRGLGLVYEKGPASLREDLVRDLMSSFSDKKSTSSAQPSLLAGQVGEDTQLFEPGALPTGSGESVSTYRDIMNLASEVGDSSLVYRFMSMAASDAVWSSRAAFGRFGLSNLLAEGGNGVEDYLTKNPKIYVSLFRYRFDPNEGVRRSMNGIWNALVKDTTKTVDKHFDAIMEDLLTQIFAREWRTRQACCTALGELVQGRPLEKYETYLQRTWDVCFKVLDDIKESVRTAAAGLARTLTGILTRTLEADTSATKNATAMLGHVLPFLLSPSGLESSAEDVRLFAISAMLDIVKKASAAALRPFIPELVERLLGLMGTLEHEAVEYIRLNASKYSVSEQKIDDMRLAGVRGSPVMASIERCLDLLDDESMAQLAPRIEAAMRSAIALPTKVACSRVLVSLATRRAFVFKPFAGQFLVSLEKTLIDRNDTVASSYAAAAGYVARSASDKAVLRLITFAKKLYFDSSSRDEAVPRKAIISGDILKALGKHANDRFTASATEILPFVFVAKHDSHETVGSLFKETWEDNVGGSRAVNLYLPEIVALVTEHLDSAQWAVKHTAARAVAEAITALASMPGGIEEPAGKMLWPALKTAMTAKSWEGKEVVLKAFVRFVETGERYWSQSDSVKTAISKMAVVEAKRQNDSYRQHSLPCLGQIAHARKDIDMRDLVYNTVKPIMDNELQLAAANDAMDVEVGSGVSEAKLRQGVIAGCVSALTESAIGRIGGTSADDADRVYHVLMALDGVQQAYRKGSIDNKGTMASIRQFARQVVPVWEAAGAETGRALEIVRVARSLSADA